jgi:hypothetical protein
MKKLKLMGCEQADCGIMHKSRLPCNCVLSHAVDLQHCKATPKFATVKPRTIAACSRFIDWLFRACRQINPGTHHLESTSNSVKNRLSEEHMKFMQRVAGFDGFERSYFHLLQLHWIIKSSHFAGFFYLRNPKKI